MDHMARRIKEGKRFAQSRTKDCLVEPFYASSGLIVLITHLNESITASIVPMATSGAYHINVSCKLFAETKGRRCGIVSNE